MSDKTASPISILKLPIERFNGFSDGVIAIVITILVLGIDVPEDHDFSEEGFISFLIKLEPSFIAYITSFLMVGLYWALHSTIFHFVKYVNRPLIWFNMFFLLTMTLLPFVSKVKAINKFDFLVLVIFASAHILTCLLIFLIWTYVNKQTALCKEEIHPVLKRKITLRILITPVICLFAIALALVSVKIGTYFFLMVMPFYFILSWFDPVDA